MSHHHLESSDPSTSRRSFIKHTSLGLAGAATMSGPLSAFAPGDAAIKIGVVGCGGRGTGAALDALGAATRVIYPSEGYHTEDVAENSRVAHTNIQIVALADLFEDRLARSRAQFAKLGMEIPEARCFTGFEVGKLSRSRDQPVIPTPPRPSAAPAGDRGEHASWKMAAVDVRASADLAESWRSRSSRSAPAPAAGTIAGHKRHSRWRDRRIVCRALGGGRSAIDRAGGATEWQPGTELLPGCQAAIREQHPQLDVINWASYTRCVDFERGRVTNTHRRSVRDHKANHFAVEFVTGAAMLTSAARSASARRVWIVRTAGSSNCANRIDPKGDPGAPRQARERLSPHARRSIAASRRAPSTRRRRCAKAAMTGILGREAVYSGQVITWDAAIKSETRLGPREYAMGPYPMPPVAMPGQYRFK
jgi:hypothetical protein